MNNIQDSILHHNFSQQLPKSISDKVQANLDSLKEKEGKFQGGYKQ
jgi:predicted outer membrane protein